VDKLFIFSLSSGFEKHSVEIKIVAKKYTDANSVMEDLFSGLEYECVLIQPIKPEMSK